MTYFLEKTFELKNFKLVPCKYASTIIRPCKWSYNKCLDFYSRKMKKNAILHLDGACVSYYGNDIEKWLITLALEKNIIPDFECHLLNNDNYDTYCMKTIDLHTQKTIEDNTEAILKNDLTMLYSFDMIEL